MRLPAPPPGAGEASEQLSLRSDRFLIGCVAENRAPFLPQAHLLVRSIRSFGGALADSAVMVCVVDEVDPHYRLLFEQEGADVRIVPRFDSRDPVANKLQFFPEAFGTRAEMLILVDCDTAFVRDPLPLICPNAIQAKIADQPTVPLEAFVELFHHYGVELPPARSSTTFGAAPIIRYCNSGVIVLPTSLAREFAPLWRRWNARLVEELDLLGSYRQHCNQASLSLALATTPAPFREAPLALNFPLHLSHLDSTAELLDTDPAIVRYHDRVASDGRLLPTPYPCAQRRVEQLNQRISAWSASRGNGRALRLARSAGDHTSARRSSCVLIVGMHRGGTSAVAQTIARLDVPFGTASDRMPPLPENPTGYWESTALSLFNEDLLEALGGSWSAPPTLAPGWQRDGSLHCKRELGKALLQSVHLDRRWAWKDPRNSLLLPFWQEALDLPLRIVLVHRNPLEIWRSLAARDGFEKPLAMALWERYTRSALEAARGLPTLVVSYEGLLEHFDPWKEALRSFLGCDTTLELEEPHHSLLDKSLRHSAFRAQDVAEDPVFSGEQRRLFELVEELLGTHEPLRIAELPPETPSTKRLLEERRTLEHAATDKPHEPSAHPLVLEGIQESVELDDLARPSAYRSYLTAHRISEERNQARLRVEVAGCTADMRISLVVGLHRQNAFRLDRALQSVRSQILSSWELCLCADGDNDDDTKTLLAGFARADDRILLSQHERACDASAAWNAALAAAKGEFVAFFDADDALAPECLAEVALVLARERRADLVYTDEDRLDDAGGRFEPFFKPGWSPDHLLSSAYLGRLLVVRRGLLERIGGLRSEYGGAEEYDLMLRATEAARDIVHIPKVLYHRGGNHAPHLPRDPEAARRTLESALRRRREDGEIEPAEVRGTFRVRRTIHRPPMVSVIIPFRDEPRLLERCLRSIREFAGYERREAILVDNGSWEPETKAVLGHVSKDGNHRVLPYPGPFNWSAINNEAARQARGDLLLFLNNDVESSRHGWLAAMVEHGLRDEIGAIGGRLLYPNGQVQHAGIMLHREALARHPFRFLPAQAPGYFAMAKVIRNCTAVTGACMMVRRKLFEELGGFDESLPLEFNDVDFCLRLLERGYRILYTPYAELTHHESLTRGMRSEPLHSQWIRRRWNDRIRHETYVSPNLPWRPAHAGLSED
jgi:GT2 family glycosyltransferase